MAQKLNIHIPRDLVIGGGWTIEWAAVDPTSGAPVTGVVITEANVVAVDVSDNQIADENLEPFMLVPGPDA